MRKTILMILTLSSLNALAADKPNILIIWGDDIGITNISAYSDGIMGYHTPNIDLQRRYHGLPHAQY